MLSFYRLFKSRKTVKTKLKKDDVIGYDAGKASRSIKLFRPLRQGAIERLCFNDTSCSVFSKTFHWPLNAEEFQSLAELMAASAGYYVVSIPCGQMPIA
jgi:hypothetical protein